jgi:hypothetical protein
MFSKTKPLSAILIATVSGVVALPAHAGMLGWASHFERVRSHNQGGVESAEGTYGVVFPLSQAEPDARMTPGALNPNVTQASIAGTICVRGYTRTIRPEESYTERLKRKQIAAYDYSDRRLRDYEEDHLVSLELGGSPTDPRNLWPEPHHVVGGWGSYAKDRLENTLHRLVCRHKVSLAEAQSMIAHDWISAYKRYVGAAPNQARGHRYGG